jgi:hypothetical protein
VEIGGWHAKFWGQNPPPEFLEAETAAQMPWYLYVAEQSPLIELDGPRVRSAGDGTFRVEATLSNAGFLPTSLTDRGAVGEERTDGSLRAQVVSPPWATLELEAAELVGGTARRTVGHLAGSNSYLRAVKERSHTVSWVVRPAGPGAVGGETGGTGGAARVRVIAGSDTGGVRRSAWTVVR